MSKLIWGLIALIILGSAFLVFWDEPLDPQTQQLLARVPPALGVQDNAYFAFLGLFADYADSPHGVGRQRVQAYEVALAERSDGSVVDYDDYPVQRRLTPGEELGELCAVEVQECLDSFVANHDTIAALGVRYLTLRTRYLELGHYGSFRTTATPGLQEPAIPLKLIVDLGRLQNATIGVEFVSGDKGLAMTALAADVRFLRDLLAESDQLVLKMSAAELLIRDLHLYAELLDAGGEAQSLPALLLQPLSAAEFSFDAAIRREFQSSALLLATIDPADTLDTGLKLPGWALRPLLKRNMSINRLGRWFRAVNTRASLSAERFRTEMNVPLVGETGAKEYLLNPIGSILVAVSRPEFGRMIARIHDLEGFLRLIRIKREILQKQIDEGALADYLKSVSAALGSPYDATPMHWDGERQVLSFDGLSGRVYYQEVHVPMSRSPSPGPEGS